MIKCDKCKSFGLEFHSTTISPHEFFEGKKDADIWIIGLNPKGDIGKLETRTQKEFEDFNPDCHPYFKDFKKVSQKLYAYWKSSNSRVAHTDLVKCYSNSFPPKIKIGDKEKEVKVDKLVDNCKVHLIKQILDGKPKLIICNGSTVCEEMIRMFPPLVKTESIETLTSYKTELKIGNEDSHKFWIVLSGFIGRVDDRNKRRFGLEIEQILQKENIIL